MKKLISKILDIMSKYQIQLIAICIVISVTIPFITDNSYVIRIITVCFLNAMLCLSFNFLAGFMGQLNLGHAAFYGIGAYTYTVLTVKFGMSTYITFLLAMIFPCVFGYLLSVVTLRLRGFYFTVCTIGFGEIVKIVNYNWTDVTRGPLGYMNIPKAEFFGITFNTSFKNYFLALFLLITLTYIIRAILNSRIGTEIIAIREDEIAAKSIGINTFLIKTMAFIISAGMAGLVGAFYASYMNFIDPTNFTYSQTSLMLIMTLFGGIGSLLGGFVGAFILTVMPELLRGLMEYRMLIYGILMVVIIIVRPYGLFGDINFKYRFQQLKVEKEEKKNE